jgi:hypothetical protein
MTIDESKFRFAFKYEWLNGVRMILRVMVWLTGDTLPDK